MSHSNDDWRVIHRVMFPTDSDPTTMPLYIDERVTISNADVAHPSARALRDDTKFGEASQEPGHGASIGTSTANTISDVQSSSARFAAHSEVSFATYFNAFPAAYWREWTSVTEVRLTVRISGTATISLYRSTSRGTLNRIDGAPDATGTTIFDVPITNFGDGGWLWFDLKTGAKPVELIDAHWSAPAALATRRGSATISITTFNRPDDCVAQIDRLAQAPRALERIDEVLFVDQGNKHIVDAAGYESAAAALGDKLRIEIQPNLGGSGGFARGMYETSRRATSDYVLLLDDDIVIEPESIVRAIDFADYTRTPTIVGGHMLNLYERSVLHSYGEAVNLYRSMWYALDPSLEAFNFATGSLRSKASIHRRVDPDFNGWWMCLIPRQVIDEIGLALPVFIKWDDAEYGLRAKAHGYRTVSLPGAAVWHMPWTEKDDRLDWQAYFHQRNRWLIGMLYSEYPRGGSLIRESFLADLKHLLTLQYSPVAMRVQALKDLRTGPEHLHATIAKRAPEMRALHSSYTDGASIRNVDEYPKVVQTRLLRRGEAAHPPRTRFRWVARAFFATISDLVSRTAKSDSAPELRVAAMDVRWWQLGGVRAALVGTADGTGVTVYRRRQDVFRTLFSESARLHLQLFREWRRLSRTYRAELESVTSQKAWEKTFSAGGSSSAQQPDSATSADEQRK